MGDTMLEADTMNDAALTLQRVHRAEAPIENALSVVRRFLARHSRSFDVALAFLLALFALLSVRYVQLALADAEVEIAKNKPILEAAIREGGVNAEQARITLKSLTAAAPRLPIPVLYGLALLVTIPLMWRRRYPTIIALVVVTTFLLTVWYSPIDSSIPSIAAWVALYSLAAFGMVNSRHRLSLLGALFVIVVLFVGGVVRNPDWPNTVALRDVVYAVAVSGLSFGSSIAFGLLTLRHRATVAELERNSALLASQRDELARTAVLDERVRIARELHDVVAHHVSVMGMQAGAARLSLLASGRDAGPDDRVATALYRLLGFLRDGGASSTVSSPQPSIERFPQLIEENLASGLDVDVRIGAGVELVSPAVSLTAYRIVQEALTNVRKHGAGATHAHVRLSIARDDLVVEIENRRGAKPSTTRSTGGHGLQGMQERVALHGGVLSVGPTADGYRVHAVLPLAGMPFVGEREREQ
jgi:signal transduction histidine kinase